MQFDELCALARDGLAAGDYDITAAALMAAGQTADEHHAQAWADERLAHVRATAGAR